MPRAKFQPVGWLFRVSDLHISEGLRTPEDGHYEPLGYWLANVEDPDKARAAVWNSLGVELDSEGFQLGTGQVIPRVIVDKFDVPTGKAKQICIAD